MVKQQLKSMRGKKVVVPEGITKIDFGCFMNSDAKEVVFPSTLKEIGWRAFYGCENIKNITLPKGSESIGAECFKNAIIEKIVVPQSVKKIGDRSFSNCKGQSTIIL